MFGLPGTAEVWLLSGMQLCENSFSWYPGIKSINAFIDKLNSSVRLSDDKYGVEKRKVSTDRAQVQSSNSADSDKLVLGSPAHKLNVNERYVISTYFFKFFYLNNNWPAWNSSPVRVLSFDIQGIKIKAFADKNNDFYWPYVFLTCC